MKKITVFAQAGAQDMVMALSLVLTGDWSGGAVRVVVEVDWCRSDGSGLVVMMEW